LFVLHLQTFKFPTFSTQQIHTRAVHLTNL